MSNPTIRIVAHTVVGLTGICLGLTLAMATVSHCSDSPDTRDEEYREIGTKLDTARDLLTTIQQGKPGRVDFDRTGSLAIKAPIDGKVGVIANAGGTQGVNFHDEVMYPQNQTRGDVLRLTGTPAIGVDIVAGIRQSEPRSAPNVDVVLAPDSKPPPGDLIIMTDGERRCRFPGAAGWRGYGDWEKIVPEDAGPETCCKMVVTPCEEVE